MNILKNDTVGRYGVAKKKFQPGAVIFSEAPFAFGPKSNSLPVCLGCYKESPSNLCSKCSWPVCNKDCEANPAHELAECKVFSEARVRFQQGSNNGEPCLQYECITPVRVLFAKEACPDRWNSEIKDMESHNSLRKNCPIWNFNQVNIVAFLRGPCKLDRFTEELIHTVCGILEINAFEARSLSGSLIRCLFPKFAVLSHNCITNVSHTIISNGKGDQVDFSLTVRAATEIKKEEELFSSYAYPISPTLLRRDFLKESKYFDCRCFRCSDPQEKGANSSTVKCSKCEEGYLTPSMPLDPDTKWTCGRCEHFVSNGDIRSLFKQLQSEIDAAEGEENEEKRLESLEGLLEKYSTMLHPINAYNCHLYLSLIPMYGNHLTNSSYQDKKLHYCKLVMKALDIIEPGYSRIRGIILYHYYMGLLLKEQKNKDIFGFNLSEAFNILDEAVSILKLEPPTSDEGKLGIFASKSLTIFEEHFEDIAEKKLKPLQFLDMVYNTP